MSLEQDINQPTFRTNYQKAIINIIYSSNWLQERVKNYVEPFKITVQQYNILRILRGSKTPLTTFVIRARMLDKMSDCSRLVQRLIAKDLVAKTANKKDKRLVDVSISTKGLHLLEALDKNIETLDDMLGNLTIEEANTLNTLLDRMRVV